MSDDKFHFQIPRDNVRVEKYEKTGGSETVPRISHKDHGVKLKEQTIRLKQVELNKKDSKFTTDIYFQIETPKEFSVKGQKAKIEQLGVEILSYSSTNKSAGTARISKEQLKDFEEKLELYIESPENTGKTYFSPIEQISSIPPESKIKTPINFESENEVDVIINLYNALALRERMAINSIIVDEIKKHTDIVEFKNFSNGISSIQCRIKQNALAEIVSEFTTIKEIKPNHTFIVENAIPAELMPNPLDIKPVESKSTICIIDSGISDANGILSSIVKGRVNHLPKGSVTPTYDHGTFVASRCIFGDNIDSCLGSHSLQPYCYVLDVAVFGKDSLGRKINPSEFELRTAIEDVVMSYSDSIKVFNLSLGVPFPINDFEFSEIAKLLDFLSKQHKVLFIVAAGNIDNKLGDFPTVHFNHYHSRIGCPAESLLALTVGSIAKFSNSTSLSEADLISPFSRIGPGADLGIKPEVVAHGGNLVDPYNQAPRVSTYGIAASGTNLAVDVGTSHAAPIISQYAQRLFDLYPNSDPNLVKGLLCHFCEERYIHDELTDNPTKFIGFGEPNIESAIRAGQYNAAFIYEGQLDQENYQYISFHVPKTFVSSQTSAKLKIRITITYDPPVNPDNEAEYSNARISAKLVKPTSSGMKPINISGEETYNRPWNPIIQFEKTFSRSYLAGAWDLRLRLYTRGNVASNYLQDYSVVIELIDENGNTNVYNDIVNEFGNIYSQIKISIAA